MKKEDNIQRFMTENKREITDNGFSERVTRRLPGNRSLDWLVGVFTGLGCLLFFLLAQAYLPKNLGLVFPSEISVYILMGACLAFPMLSYLVYRVVNKA